MLAVGCEVGVEQWWLQKRREREASHQLEATGHARDHAPINECRDIVGIVQQEVPLVVITVDRLRAPMALASGAPRSYPYALRATAMSWARCVGSGGVHCLADSTSIVSGRLRRGLFLPTIFAV